MYQSVGSHGKADNSDRFDERGVRVKRQTKDSKISYDSAYYDECLMEENHVMKDFNKSSSKKMENRHSSPHLIARLMGLETTPQIISKRESNASNCFHTSSSHGKYISLQEHFFLQSSKEDKQFKDVYEVTETSNVNHKKRSTRKEIQGSNMGDVDIHFRKHNFMDAKQRSTSEAVHTSEEFDDTFEVLDNEELLLKFLQDPDSLFGKHVHDLKSQVPTSNLCQITILKSSKSAKSGRWTKPEKSPKRSSNLFEEFTDSFEKPESIFPEHLFEEHSQSVPYKPSTLDYCGENETHYPPTRIVVLKPNLRKENRMAGDFSRANENPCFGSTKNREFSISGIQELHTQGIERGKLSDDLEYLDYRAKSSREIAKEVTRQLRQKVSRHSKNALTTDLSICSGNATIDFDRHCQLGDRFDEWLNGSKSSLCRTESSVNREARRRLSERWKKTCHIQEVKNVARGSSTLGEMLALPDRAPLCTPMDSSGNKKVADENFVVDEVLGTCDIPLGISSKDGWIDGSCKTLGHSMSLPSASANPNSKLGNRNQFSQSKKEHLLKDALNMGTDELYKSNFCRKRVTTQVRGSTYGTNRCKQTENIGEESVLLEQEIHVNSEGPRKSIHVRCLSQDHPFLPDLMVPDGEDSLENDLKPIYEDKLHFSTCQEEKEEQYVFKMPSETDDASCTDQIFVATEETSTQLPMDPLQSDNADLVNLKELGQPSPNSVLEATSEEEESSSSECFERISANLQELRTQLKLLKMESGSTYEEEMDVSVSSDAESDGGSCSVVSTANVHQAFGNDDDRDFSYLLDMLIESGIHDCEQERLSSCCYTMNCPVTPTVFDKLEKKYELVVPWTRSERKLLFDLINGILAEAISPCINLRPWVGSRRHISAWNQDGLVEALWQMVVRHKEYLHGDPEDSILEKRWLFLEDHVEETGKELEMMLSDDLLEELVSEFFTCQVPHKFL